MAGCMNTDHPTVWVLIGLLALTVPLVAFARRINVPYPIVLVLGGLVMGFMPFLPPIQLDPRLVLVVFLPPLLYWESVNAPTDVIRKNYRQVWVLAIGLVAVTTAVVAAVAHAIVPQMGWPMAFVLGAIVAPTDELAAVPVLERLGIPRHLIAIIEGESLLNDASSLILYAAAIAVMVNGTFDPVRTFWMFPLAVGGAIALGLLTGRIAVEGWRRVPDTQLQTVISFNLPYLTYMLADRIGFSGVIALVFTGSFVNRSTPRVITPATRLQVTGFWETLVFLANAMLFLLIGFQLNAIAHNVIVKYSWQSLVFYVVVVNAAVIGTRFLWITLQQYAPFAGGSSEHKGGNWKHALIASWSGLRGAVSLAAALAIPATIATGAATEHRDLVIFLTFSVILITLLGGGLTLPWIIRVLKVGDEKSEDAGEVEAAFAGAARAAFDRIEVLCKSGRFSEEQAEHIRRHFQHLHDHPGEGHDEAVVVAAIRDVIAAQRQTIIEMRERGEIDNTVLRRLQHRLDLAEERLD